MTLGSLPRSLSLLFLGFAACDYCEDPTMGFGVDQEDASGEVAAPASFGLVDVRLFPEVGNLQACTLSDGCALTLSASGGPGAVVVTTPYATGNSIHRAPDEMEIKAARVTVRGVSRPAKVVGGQVAVLKRGGGEVEVEATFDLEVDGEGVANFRMIRYVAKGASIRRFCAD